jgi:glycosyltransferase involved in cell wall biosynthesis
VIYGLHCNGELKLRSKSEKSIDRVLFISNVFGRHGGLEIYNLNLVHALKNAGCSVTVWGVYDAQDGLTEGIPHAALAPQDSLMKKLYVRFFWKPLLISRLLIGLRRYDLLVVGHPHLLEAIWRPARWLDVPYWAWTYGMDVWGEWTLGMRAGLCNASQLVAISHYTRDSVRRRLPDKEVLVIPNAIDVDHFRPIEMPEREEIVLLTVGRLSSQARHKGHDVVIQALPRIQSGSSRPVVYHIAGTGDDVPRLRRIAKKMKVEASVRFLGYVPEDELVSTYNQCDVFVMPSRLERQPNGLLGGEGFGFVFIEAAACGKPVVGSNQGGAAEAVAHGVTGFTVDPTSVDEVVDAVCLLLGNTDLAYRMGNAGRRYAVQDFSLASFDRRIARLLQESGVFNGCSSLTGADSGKIR